MSIKLLRYRYRALFNGKKMEGGSFLSVTESDGIAMTDGTSIGCPNGATASVFFPPDGKVSQLSLDPIM